MFKRMMVVLSVVAAATLGFGVSQAIGQTTIPPKAPGYMYAACSIRGVLSSTALGATSCKEQYGAHYVVTFNRTVRGCALMGTIGTEKPDTFNRPGQISTGWGAGANQVSVETANVGSTSYNARSFFITVLC